MRSRCGCECRSFLVSVCDSQPRCRLSPDNGKENARKHSSSTNKSVLCVCSSASGYVIRWAPLRVVFKENGMLCTASVCVGWGWGSRLLPCLPHAHMHSLSSVWCCLSESPIVLSPTPRASISAVRLPLHWGSLCRIVGASLPLPAPALALYLPLVCGTLHDG